MDCLLTSETSLLRLSCFHSYQHFRSSVAAMLIHDSAMSVLDVVNLDPTSLPRKSHLRYGLALTLALDSQQIFWRWQQHRWHRCCRFNIPWRQPQRRQQRRNARPKLGMSDHRCKDFLFSANVGPYGDIARFRSAVFPAACELWRFVAASTLNAIWVERLRRMEDSTLPNEAHSSQAQSYH
ncbi:unnamed protein product [Peronospora belbahrii]|uniref:Uncharacterized protein n=1 Tax=Peronospora belbahrii TaxID=622444 RepID=A0AAU9LBB7_9STRA|nr:unnamed protein product [Peronospora belbahrii]CAH0521798.1 unnamed protein product [Peronospora belbahrii]